MTDLVIRALDESDAHLFDALPDPLGARAAHRRTTLPPRLEAGGPARRHGRRARRLVGRPRRHGTPQRQLVRRGRGRGGGGGRTPALRPLARRSRINLPGGWRDNPAPRAAAEARFTAPRAAGYDLLVERFLYRWTPERGLPERPGRLVFGPEPDDAVFFDALRRIHSVTLDAHA